MDKFCWEASATCLSSAVWAITFTRCMWKISCYMCSIMHVPWYIYLHFKLKRNMCMVYWPLQLIYMLLMVYTYEQNDYVEGAHDIEASLQAQCPSTITYWGFVESDRMDKPFAKHKHPNFVLALSTVQSYHMQQPQFHCLDFKGEAITST